VFKRLMIIGGILNTLFFLFHVFLCYQIHQLTKLAAGYRGLLEAFSIAGTLFIFFFAYASFLHQKDLLETKLGHSVLALTSLLYLSRAAEEFILFKFKAVIFASCLLVGAIYVAALVMVRRERPTAALPLAA